MTIFSGEMPLLRKCDSAALACFNWVGKGESGVSAKSGVFKTFVERILMEPTVLQRYDTDVTEGSRYVFLQSVQESKIVGSRRQAEAPS